MSVEWSYFAPKCIKFYLQPSRYETYFQGKKYPIPLAYMGREGIKGFLPLKKPEGGKDRRGAIEREKYGRGRVSSRGSCSKVLWGIVPPDHQRKLRESVK